MPILVDTNVLLRSLRPDHPHFPAALHALEILRPRDVLCVAPQNLIEFWAVATRSIEERGLGMNHGQAGAEIGKIRQWFHLLPPAIGVLDTWQKMVLDLRISGKQAHDTHLAAAMMVHGIDSILTFNVADFTRYPGITVIDPVKI